MYARYVCLMFASHLHHTNIYARSADIMGICCRLFGIMDKSFQKENNLTAAFIQNARGFWRLNGINTHSFTYCHHMDIVWVLVLSVRVRVCLQSKARFSCFKVDSFLFGIVHIYGNICVVYAMRLFCCWFFFFVFSTYGAESWVHRFFLVAIDTFARNAEKFNKTHFEILPIRLQMKFVQIFCS